MNLDAVTSSRGERYALSQVFVHQEPHDSVAASGRVPTIP